jgi:hypothetical protein
MGQLQSTGVAIAGHSTTFLYHGAAEDRICVMICSCGWSTPIAAFRHPHSIIECQRRFDRHLADVDVEPSTPRDEHRTPAHSREDQT